MTDPLSDIDLSNARFERGVPFEDFARLRRHAPVWWSEAEQCWTVTTYELVERFNRDWATFSSAGGNVAPGSMANRTDLSFLDPPEHTHLRRVMTRRFLPRAVAAIEPGVRATVDEVVADFVAAGGGDAVPELAARIPFRVMADLLGVPRTAESRVTRWGNVIAPNDDPEFRPGPDSAPTAVAELDAFLVDLVADRRRAPGDDLVSDMVRARLDGGRTLSGAEIGNIVMTFLLAGIETTRNLLAIGLHLLIENPVERARFVAGEVGAVALVEELLRWITPVLQHSRWSTREVEVAGVVVPAGQRLALWMVSANHDETRFADPDRLDAGRSPNPHSSLGAGGPHYCIGAGVARMEAAATFEALRPHLDRLVVTGPVPRVRSNFMNSVKHLPVAVQGPGA